MTFATFLYVLYTGVPTFAWILKSLIGMLLRDIEVAACDAFWVLLIYPVSSGVVLCRVVL